MLKVCRLKIDFVDPQTGEVIRNYNFEKSFDNEVIKNNDLYKLLNVKTLVFYLSSFIRGCYKIENLILSITFTTDNIF